MSLAGGRGADLASASLSVNGSDVGAQIDKRTTREWSIHASQALGAGSYDVWVLTLATGDIRPVTADPSNEFHPSWRGQRTLSKQIWNQGPFKDFQAGS